MPPCRRSALVAVLLPTVVIAVYFVGAGALPVGAAIYDAYNGFSVSNGNANGVWSYGTLSSFTGGSFSLYNSGQTFSDYSVWRNDGAGYPYDAGVYKPVSGNLLHLDGQSYISDVRFVAPVSGTYDVSGYFTRTDGWGWPVNVRIIENGTTTLFAVDNFTSSNTQQPFNFSSLYLPAGTTLDFAEGAPQPNNDSTGLSATITSVPEPATLAIWSLLGTLAIGIGWWRKRRTA
jgi:hypothetical protein